MLALHLCHPGVYPTEPIGRCPHEDEEPGAQSECHLLGESRAVLLSDFLAWPTPPAWEALT